MDLSSQARFLGTDALEALAAVVLAASALWSSYLIALRLSPRSSAARSSAGVRFCATAVALAWQSAALFWLLVPFSLFRASVAVPLWAALACALHVTLARSPDTGAGDDPPGHAWTALRADLASAAARLRELAARPAGWALGATLLLALVRLVRGSVSPPLGWDALTYHLYKAGRWVQLGNLAAQPAPDAWGYYEYYPVVGDVFWAWTMLLVRSGALLTLAGTAVWLALLLGVYTAARALGARSDHAALAACALSAMPSSMAYLSSGYVDNTTTALFILGAVFVIRVVGKGALPEAPLAIGALALMLGTKLTTAAYFLVGAVMVVYAVVRAREPGRVRRLIVLGCLAAAVAGSPSYQRAWVEQDSPFYPFRIAFGSVVLSEGSETATAVGRDLRSANRYQLGSPLAFWAYFLARPKTTGAFVNPGPVAVVLALLALLGAAELARRRGSRRGAVFLAACALLTLAGFLSGNMATFRQTFKVSTAGRYVLPGFAAAAVLGAGWSARIARSLWIPGILVSLYLALPGGWQPVEAAPLLWGTGIVLVLGAGLFAAARLGARRGRWLVAAALLATVALAASEVALERVRRAYRYPLYEAAADPADPIYHMHGLHAIYTSAWHIWRALDGPEPHRLAVVAGFDGIGHNWYRYPLLGSRLQNRIAYVPITADGSIVDYRLPAEVDRRADFRRWVERLVEDRIEYVVSLAPRTTIEDLWMRETPELFEVAFADPPSLNAAYRFDRERAIELLTGTGSTAPPAPTGPGSPGTAGR
jgi:hypothetical protein